MPIRFDPRDRLVGAPFGGSIVGSWLSRGFVKSVQRGTISLVSAVSNTATITSVVLANSLISWNGWTYGADTDPDGTASCARVELTNVTTVTALKSAAAGTTILSYEVLEFVPGVLRSCQRGTITLSGATSNTATITKVNILKTQLSFLGFLTSQASGYWGRLMPQIKLESDGVTITASKGIATDSTVVGYQAAEFF